jgi:hypothetical protein
LCNFIATTFKRNLRTWSLLKGLNTPFSRMPLPDLEDYACLWKRAEAKAEARTMTTQGDRLQNHPAIEVISEHVRTRFRMRDSPLG